jgi:tripartite ATP-independent transporter DctM subunit
MDLSLITVLMVVLLLIFIFLGLPITFCLSTTALVFTVLFWGPGKMSVLVTSTFGNMTNPTFLAIPLFIYMAAVLQSSGITDDLFDAIWKWMGGLKGGLAIASVIAITILSAMTGVGATGIFTIGKIAYPQMMKRGYDQMIAIGPIPPASALGPLIPPSNIMIILGGFASLSVGALFMGGFVPGIMISLGFCTYILIRCYRHPELAPNVPVAERPTLREKLVATRGVALPLLLVLAVLGGIWTGVTTAVEGAGVGAFGAMICALIKRKLNFASLREAVTGTIKASVMVMWLLIGGSVYAAFMSASGMSSYLGKMLMNLPIPPMGIVGLLLAVVLVMGMFIDSVAIIMITVPIFFPIITTMNYDPIWFGVIYTISIVIGYITPPFGYNLFYMRAIIPADVSTKVIYRSVMPYIPIMIIVMVICMVFPELVTALPKWFIGE